MVKKMVDYKACGGRGLRITIGIAILVAFIRKGICVGTAGAPTMEIK